MGKSDNRITVATRTHQGRRPYNQDVVRADTIALKGGQTGYLLLVADGMGGAAAGEIAAKVAAQALHSSIVKWFKGNPVDAENVASALRIGFREAHEAVQRAAAADPSRHGMGTTLVAAFVWDDRYVVANVGDSRAYVIDSGDIAQITKDHSAVQEMIDRGVIRPEHRATAPMAHALTRAIGDAPKAPEVDVFPREGSYSLRPGQVLLLCSDGLENGADDDTIHQLVCGIPSLDDAAEALVRAAWHGGSKDNISVVLLERGHLPRRSPPVPMPPPIGRAPVKRRRPRPSPVPALVLFVLAAGLGTATWRVWQTAQMESRPPSARAARGAPGEAPVPPSTERPGREGFAAPTGETARTGTTGAMGPSRAPESSPEGLVVPAAPPRGDQEGSGSAPSSLAKGDRERSTSRASREDRPRRAKASGAGSRLQASKPESTASGPSPDGTSAERAGAAVPEPSGTPPGEGSQGAPQASGASSKSGEGGSSTSAQEAAVSGGSGVEPGAEPSPAPSDSSGPAPTDSPSTSSSVDSSKATPADTTQGTPESETSPRSESGQ